MVREYQRPHPRRTYGRGVGLEDASDNGAIRRHVKIVGTPVPGRARGQGAFEDEVHSASYSRSRISSRLRWSSSRANCLIATASALSRSGASTEPRYSPLLRMMMTRQLR